MCAREIRRVLLHRCFVKSSNGIFYISAALQHNYEMPLCVSDFPMQIKTKHHAHAYMRNKTSICMVCGVELVALSNSARVDLSQQKGLTRVEAVRRNTYCVLSKHTCSFWWDFTVPNTRLLFSRKICDQETRLALWFSVFERERSHIRMLKAIALFGTLKS